MIYSQELKDKLNEYYISKWGLTEGKKGWLIGECPYCLKARKWGVNIESSRTNCFVCGPGKDPLREILKLEELKTFNEVFSLLKVYKGIPQLISYEEEIVKAPLNLPEEYRLITQGSSEYAQMFRRVLKSRGFRISYLRKKGVGYCTSGEYAGRVILPYYRAGKLVYLNARAIFEGDTKFKNPKEESLGYGKTQVIYNWDCLYLYTKVNIVESVMNALTLGDNTTAMGGKTLSSWQISEVVRSPVKDITIILDDDAILEAYQLALQLVSYKRVRVVEMPEGRDVNAIGKKATLKLIKASPYLTEREILGKIRKHR